MIGQISVATDTSVFIQSVLLTKCYIVQWLIDCSLRWIDPLVSHKRSCGAEDGVCRRLCGEFGSFSLISKWGCAGASELLSPILTFFIKSFRGNFLRESDEF